MPERHDFSRAGRNAYASRLAGASAVTIVRPGGSVGEQPCAALPEMAPDSLTGIVGDTLFYIYNPRDDVLSVRLKASLTDAVTPRHNGQDYQLLVSDESGFVVGLIVFGYLRRFDFLAPLVPLRPGDAVNRDLIEHGLAPLRELLPAA